VRDSLKPDGGSTVVGTFGYMAPEQFQGRALPASDVYAVGATALSLLIGVEPDKLPHQGLGIDVSRALAGLGDPAMTRVLSAMLEIDPDRRASRIAPLLDELEASPRRSKQRDFRARVGQHGHAFRHRTRPGDELVASPLIYSLLWIGLTVASLATWALFQVMLPLILTALSIAFGAPLRRAASRCRDTGRRGRSGLGRAKQALRIRADRAAAVRHAARVRVAVDESVPQQRTRIASDPLEEEPIPERPARRKARHN
jgi:hypothetical protein